MSKVDISVRREIESYLFNIGLSLQEVATVLDIHIGSAKNDYNALGGKSKFQTKLSPAERRSKTYAAALVLYSRSVFDDVSRGKSKEIQSGLRLALEKYLDIKYMKAVADGLAATINILCQPNDSIEYHGHRVLLNAIFGRHQNVSGGGVFVGYLYGISSGKIITPDDRKTLSESIALWAVEQHQEKFSFRLGEEVVRAIDSALETLTPREQEIISMRFGMGCDCMTLDQISNQLNITRERIRQIEDKAFRKLRHPSRSRKLRGFVSARQAVSNYLQDMFPAPPIIKTPEMPLDNLNKSVDELEVSVRLYNCLKNLDVRYIHELVQKTEHELLMSKHFGRRTLNELKEILESMNLSLGMKLAKEA